MHTTKTLLIAALFICLLVPTAPSQAADHQLPPVILFPGWFGTTLEVTVDHQTAFPECPSSGTFEVLLFNPNPSSQFSPVCQDKLLTLVLDSRHHRPMTARISNQPGVSVTIKDYGTIESTSLLYEPMFAHLEAAGYVRNLNIRVAGYDSRLTPDMDGFVERTVALIEETYHQNGGTPVHLVGHSNGPLYAQYLLTHTSQAWRNKYIHGFTPIAGNWAGQGGVIFMAFTGMNLNTPYPGAPSDPENAASSAAMFQSFPTTYMSSADPKVFKKQVVLIGVAGGKQYTPKDYRQLFRDADMPVAQELAEHYVGLVKFATPKYFPNVDVYAEKGSGLDTLVGIELQELQVATWESNVSNIFLRDGDGNQEDITNDAIQDAWAAMRCYRFEFHDNPGVDHISLVMSPDVLDHLLIHLQQPRSSCSSN